MAAPNRSSDDHAKFNAAVAALNESAHADQMFAQYAATFDWNSGPTGKESNVDVFQRWNTSAWLDRANRLKLALDAKPGVGPFGPAARKFVRTLQTLVDTVRPATIYYAGDAYNVDHLAGGRAMHTSLVAAYRAFHSASDQMRAVVQNIDRQNRASQLAELKSNGRLLEYGMLLNLIRADDIIQFVQAELAKGNGILQIDLAKLQSYIDKLDESFSTFRSMQESNDSGGTRWDPSAFDTASRRFVEEWRCLNQALRSHQQVDEIDFSFEDNSSGDVIRRYNEMVAAYNNLKPF